MQNFYLILTLFLVANIGVALFRAIRGPTPADRLTTALLFGTTGVAVLLVLAEMNQVPALRNVALLFSLLAVLIILAFARPSGHSTGNRESE